MLRHLLPFSGNSFNLKIKENDEININEFNGSAESFFFKENEGYVSYTSIQLCKQLIKSLGKIKGNKVTNELIEKLEQEDFNLFAQLFLENNRKLWNEVYPPDETEKQGKKPNFKKVPYEQKAEESRIDFLKRMFDLFYEEDDKAIKKMQQETANIIGSNKAFEAIKENYLSSKALDDQLESFNAQKAYLLRPMPSQSEKTNEILREVSNNLGKTIDISISQARMIKSLNEIGIAMATASAKNIRNATRFNITAIIIAIISIVLSTGFAIFGHIDSKQTELRNKEVFKAILDESRKGNMVMNSLSQSIIKLDSSIAKIKSNPEIKTK